MSYQIMTPYFADRDGGGYILWVPINQLATPAHPGLILWSTSRSLPTGWAPLLYRKSLSTPWHAHTGHQLLSAAAASCLRTSAVCMCPNCRGGGVSLAPRMSPLSSSPAAVPEQRSDRLTNVADFLIAQPLCVRRSPCSALVTLAGLAVLVALQSAKAGKTGSQIHGPKYSRGDRWLVLLKLTF